MDISRSNKIPPMGVASDPRTKIGITHVLRSFVNTVPSAEMAVDGSVTPVDFTVGPPASEVWYLVSLTYYLQDKGSWSIFGFGASASPLTNGIQLIQSRPPATSVVANYATNGNFIFFHDADFQIISDSSFVGNESAIFGERVFANPDRYILDGDNSDILTMRVRDDLTFMSTVRYSATFIKEFP